MEKIHVLLHLCVLMFFFHTESKYDKIMNFSRQIQEHQFNEMSITFLYSEYDVSVTLCPR